MYNLHDYNETIEVPIKASEAIKLLQKINPNITKDLIEDFVRAYVDYDSNEYFYNQEKTYFGKYSKKCIHVNDFHEAKERLKNIAHQMGNVIWSYICYCGTEAEKGYAFSFEDKNAEWYELGEHICIYRGGKFYKTVKKS